MWSLPRINVCKVTEFFLALLAEKINQAIVETIFPSYLFCLAHLSQSFKSITVHIFPNIIENSNLQTCETKHCTSKLTRRKKWDLLPGKM